MSKKNILIIIGFGITNSLCAQTYKELQSDFEQSRLDAFNGKLSRIEIYSFKNNRDSTLKSYETFDSTGNILSARYYNYKNRRYFNEEFYNYDSLGRRISRTSRNTFLNKLKHGDVKSIDKYEYKGDSLSKRTFDSYFDDSLVESREFPGIEGEKINYLKEEKDSSGRNILIEFYSVAGLERVEFNYHANGKIQSNSVYIYDRIWYKYRYNDLGNIIECYEWNYRSNSKIPIEHSLTYYDTDQMVTMVEYLNSKNKIKSFNKYYYKKY